MGFVIIATHSTEEPRQVELAGDTWVGRSSTCHLVLPRGASFRHARFSEQAGRVTVVDLDSEDGASVNGRRIDEVTPVGVNDTVTIGEWSLRIELVADIVLAPFTGRTPRERELVATMAERPDDDELRVVYADWLEENGFAREAETLRLERVITDERAAGPLGFRLVLVAAETELTWRALAMRPPIEGCDEDGCPTWWSALARTDDAATRRCTVCKKDVRFSESIKVARRNLARRCLVVLDPIVKRSQGDLVEPVLGEIALLRAARCETLQLPFFKTGAPQPQTVAELRESLAIPPHAELEPLTPLVYGLRAEAEADGSLRSYAIDLRTDVDVIQQHFRMRYATPLEVREANRVYSAWGGLLFRRIGARCELRWEADPPAWMRPPPRDAAATLAFLGALGAVLRDGASMEAMLDFASRPPANAGLDVNGPLGAIAFWLNLAPPLPAADLVAALAIPDVDTLIVPSDPKKMFHEISSPTFGPWALRLVLAENPKGTPIAETDHYTLDPADRIERVYVMRRS